MSTISGYNFTLIKIPKKATGTYMRFRCRQYFIWRKTRTCPFARIAMGSRASRPYWATDANRRALRLLILLTVLALLLAIPMWPSPSSLEQGTSLTLDSDAPCTVRHKLPRVVSHRAVDEDQAGGAAPSSAKWLRALLDAGITSFDVDLFWAADDGGAELFVGHPPSLRNMWSLAAEVNLTPLSELKQHAHPDGLLRLVDMLRILAGHRNALGQLSLELKFPSDPEWHRRLSFLYDQINAARLATHVAVVALDATQAAAHRAAQVRAGLRVPILVVVRDNDAPVGRDGLPHANLSLFAHEPLYDGWSASWKVLDAELRSASTAIPGRKSKPLAVWVCDQEPELRRVWSIGAEDVVSNRALWARKLLEHWHREEETRCRRAER